MELSLDEFESLFILEGAPHSLAKYHETVDGTSGVTFSKWKQKSADSIMTVFERDISFTHGTLIKTRCVKTQRKYRDKNGIVVYSSTKMTDVPEADAFTVDDVLSVTALDSNKIIVEISREIIWSRSSILNWPIELNTNR